MFKNCSFKKLACSQAGFTLVEVQIYLTIMAIVALMVCHIALMYTSLFDRVALSAHHAVMMLAAIVQVNEACDTALVTPQKAGQLTVGSFVKKDRLMAVINDRQNLLLDKVTHFDASPDLHNNRINGVAFTCTWHGKQYRWYRASRMKAFACSSFL